MIREIVQPQENVLHIPIPNEYINRKIEVLIFDVNEPTKKEQENNKLLEEFRRVSQHVSNVDKNIDILKLDEDMNRDLF